MPSAPSVTAFIGLGANLNHTTATHSLSPENTLASAVHALRQLAGGQLVAASSLYASAPLGPADQPPYTNAVVRLITPLTPHGLLAALHAIETAHGRERSVRWGARTLDLDLLLYGRDSMVTPDLTLPHAELCARNFVLIPLLELAPELTLPDGRHLHTLPAAQSWAGLHIVHAGSAWANPPPAHG